MFNFYEDTILPFVFVYLSSNISYYTVFKCNLWIEFRVLTHITNFKGKSFIYVLTLVFFKIILVQ